MDDNGIRDPIKRTGLLQWLSQLPCDFVCVQQTHVTDTAEAASWFSSSGFLTVTVSGTAHSRGQVLLYRPSVSFVNSWVELDGRFLMAEFSRKYYVFRLAFVYAPNRNFERYEFFTSCLEFTDPSVPSILGGDFNAVFDRTRDRRGSDAAVTVRDSFVSLELIFREFCVLDVWRHLHPDLRAYTWQKPDGSLSSRIDLIGFPSTWLHLVSSCPIVPCPFSDHDAVFLGFSIAESFPHGPGRWKLNVSVLREPVFLQKSSGLDGGRVSRLFHLFRIGGTEARNISKVLRPAIVVVLIMNVLCRALSFLHLLDI